MNYYDKHKHSVVTTLKSEFGELLFLVNLGHE